MDYNEMQRAIEARQLIRRAVLRHCAQCHARPEKIIVGNLLYDRSVGHRFYMNWPDERRVGEWAGIPLYTSGRVAPDAVATIGPELDAEK